VSRRRQRVVQMIWAAAIGAVLILAGRSSYNYWVETRAWAHAVHLPSGTLRPLSQDIAFVGRPIEGMQGVEIHVPLESRRVSHMHLIISQRGDVMDLRSVYGTTVNAQWLPYGSFRRLKPGDIMVLSGLELLRYRPIEWHFWDVVPHVLGRTNFHDEES